ncbi:unnamed protein product [Staurois parvus]|uniref:Ribonuclease A-domain domain-containing protein n=1 Tax=Staurois parvus TaxID=386267 RepID=A0ABN9HJX4_9NEOB|nr:unnamed protein product [Staurois parvus]
MSNPIYIIHGSCKTQNTFIFSKIQKIKEICSNIRAPRNVTGTGPFRLIICKKKDKNCLYAEHKKDSAICLTCETYKPIHLVKAGRC